MSKADQYFIITMALSGASLYAGGFTRTAQLILAVAAAITGINLYYEL